MNHDNDPQIRFNRAAYAGELEEMDKALSLGANINSTDLSVRTHLVLAIRMGKWHVFDFLLSHGADPNVVEKSGLTSIHHMVESSGRSSTYTPERLWHLIRAGVDIATTDYTGRTALHVGASSNGSFETLGVLLDQGLSIEARDNLGRTPLHHAAQAGAAEAVVWLLERGASETAVDNDGKTPQTHARRAAVSAFEAWQARRAIENVLKLPKTGLLAQTYASKNPDLEAAFAAHRARAAIDDTMSHAVRKATK